MKLNNNNKNRGKVKMIYKNHKNIFFAFSALFVLLPKLLCLYLKNLQKFLLILLNRVMKFVLMIKSGNKIKKKIIKIKLNLKVLRFKMRLRMKMNFQMTKILNGKMKLINLIKRYRVENILEEQKMVNLMEMEYITGQMVQNMQENFHKA